MDLFLDASSTLVKPSHLEADNIREMPCGSWRDGYSKDRRQGNRPEGCQVLPGPRAPKDVDGRRGDACGPLKGGLYHHYQGKADPAIDVLKRIRRVFHERILAIGREIPGPHRTRIRPAHNLLKAKAAHPRHPSQTGSRALQACPTPTSSCSFSPEAINVTSTPCSAAIHRPASRDRASVISNISPSTASLSTVPAP